MNSRFPLTAIAILLSLAVSGCGTSPPAQPPTTLTGNWSLAGTRTPGSYPLLLTTLLVSGNQITGGGSVQIQCSSMSGIGGFLPLSGTIANDGTFQAATQTIGSTTLGTYQVSISGNSPSGTGSQNWTGSYTLTASIPAIQGFPGCSYNHSATFTATPIAAFTGTYTGSITSLSGTGLGTNPSITLNVSQGTPTVVAHGNTSDTLLPLTASIEFAGSPCFTSGTTVSSTALGSDLEGDSVDIRFNMNDGSTLLLGGNLSDPSASLVNTHLVVNGGACNLANASASLTRK